MTTTPDLSSRDWHQVLASLPNVDWQMVLAALPAWVHDWEFSATQVESYELCRRKWAWRKIHGIESPPNESLSLGSEVHKQLEDWFRYGKQLDLTSRAGNIALAGLHLLPPPGTPGLLIEEPFHLQIFGHKFRGYKDLEIRVRVPPIVSDHKTTKNFRWAKTPDDLKENIQACLYAADTMFRTDSNECDLQWTYFRTTGTPDAVPSCVRVTRQDVSPTLERVIRTCNEMKVVLASGLRADQLPPTASACEAFGGCEYQSLCNLSPEEKMRAFMTQQGLNTGTNPFMDKLHNGINPPLLAPGQGGAVPYPMAAPPGPPPTPIQDPTTGQWVLPQAQPQPTVQHPGPPPTPVQDPATGQWILPQAQPQSTMMPQVQQMQPQPQTVSSPPAQQGLPFPAPQQVVAPEPPKRGKGGRKKATTDSSAPQAAQHVAGHVAHSEAAIQAAVDQAAALLAQAATMMGANDVKFVITIDGNKIKKSMQFTKAL